MAVVLPSPVMAGDIPVRRHAAGGSSHSVLYSLLLERPAGDRRRHESPVSAANAAACAATVTSAAASEAGSHACMGATLPVGGRRTGYRPHRVHRYQTGSPPAPGSGPRRSRPPPARADRSNGPRRPDHPPSNQGNAVRPGFTVDFGKQPARPPRLVAGASPPATAGRVHDEDVARRPLHHVRGHGAEQSSRERVDTPVAEDDQVA